MAAKLAVSRRLRSTPYTSRVEALGVSDYSIVNHMVLPKGFGRTVDEDYWHLKEHVQLWDVSCQRQVSIQGPGAKTLVQLMTPRDLRSANVGQCLYVPLIDECAGMINDPVLLKLKEDHYWLSIADSDVLLWAKGLAVGMKLEVHIDEPSVYPLAIQGPKSDELMAKVFGDPIKELKFFRFTNVDFKGYPLLVARSGYSRQGGFEIYLDKPFLGTQLWDTLWDAGQAYNIAPGSPNLIERVEGGLLSYGNEFTRENNPFECGFSQYCHLDSDIEFIGQAALQKIADQGITQQIRGVMFDGDPCPSCPSTWPLLVEESSVGYVTTAIWSPRFKQNVALGMVNKTHWKAGSSVLVELSDEDYRLGHIVDLPFPPSDIE